MNNNILFFTIINILITIPLFNIVSKKFKKENIFVTIILTSLLWVSQITISGVFLGWVVEKINFTTWVIPNICFSTILLIINKKRLKPNFIQFLHKSSTFLKEIKHNKNSFFISLLIILFTIEISINFLRVHYYPEMVWDSWVYQMHPVVDWYQKEKFGLVESPNYWVNQEILGPKVIYLWNVIITGDNQYIDFHQFFIAILLVILVFSYSRFLNLSLVNTIIGSILVYNIPIVLIQSHTSQEHITLSYYFLCSIFLYSKIVYENKKELFPFLVISLSFTLTSKTVGIMYIPLFSGIIALNHPKHFINKFLLPNFTVKNLIISTLIVLSVTSFWILRNYNGLVELSYGNSGISEAIARVETNIPFYQKYIDSFSYNFSEFPKRILDFQFFFEANSQNVSSFGLFFFSFGLISYLYSFYLLVNFKLESKIQLLFLAAVILQLVYFSFYGGIWNYRLFSLTPIVGILLTMVFISKIFWDQSFKNLFYGMVLTSIIFNFLSIHNAEDGNVETRYYFRNYLSSEERTSIAFSDRLATHSSWKFINDYIPNKYPIAYLTITYDAWTYLYYDNLLKRNIYYVSPTYYKYDYFNHKIEILPSLYSELRNKNINLLHIRYDNLKYIDYKDQNLFRITEGLYLIL